MIAGSNDFAIMNSQSIYWLEDEMCIERRPDGTILAHEQYTFGPNGIEPVRTEHERKRFYLTAGTHHI